MDCFLKKIVPYLAPLAREVLVSYTGWRPQQEDIPVTVRNPAASRRWPGSSPPPSSLWPPSSWAGRGRRLRRLPRVPSQQASHGPSRLAAAAALAHACTTSARPAPALLRCRATLSPTAHWASCVTHSSPTTSPSSMRHRRGRQHGPRRRPDPRQAVTGTGQLLMAGPAASSPACSGSWCPPNTHHHTYCRRPRILLPPPPSSLPPACLYSPPFPDLFALLEPIGFSG